MQRRNDLFITLILQIIGCYGFDRLCVGTGGIFPIKRSEQCGIPIQGIFACRNWRIAFITWSIAACPNKAVILFWDTTALLGDPYCIRRHDGVADQNTGSYYLYVLLV